MPTCDVLLICLVVIAVCCLACCVKRKRTETKGRPEFHWGDKVEVTSGEYAGLVYKVTDISWHVNRGWAYGGKEDGKSYTFYADKLALSERI